MDLPSPVPKSKGPGAPSAPSAWSGNLTGTDATRRPKACQAPAAGARPTQRQNRGTPFKLRLGGGSLDCIPKRVKLPRQVPTLLKGKTGVPHSSSAWVGYRAVNTSFSQVIQSSRLPFAYYFRQLTRLVSVVDQSVLQLGWWRLGSVGWHGRRFRAAAVFPAKPRRDRAHLHQLWCKPPEKAPISPLNRGSYRITPLESTGWSK